MNKNSSHKSRLKTFCNTLLVTVLFLYFVGPIDIGSYIEYLEKTKQRKEERLSKIKESYPEMIQKKNELFLELERGKGKLNCQDKWLWKHAVVARNIVSICSDFRNSSKAIPDSIEQRLYILHKEASALIRFFQETGKENYIAFAKEKLGFDRETAIARFVQKERWGFLDWEKGSWLPKAFENDPLFRRGPLVKFDVLGVFSVIGMAILKFYRIVPLLLLILLIRSGKNVFTTLIYCWSDFFFVWLFWPALIWSYPRADAGSIRYKVLIKEYTKNFGIPSWNKDLELQEFAEKEMSFKSFSNQVFETYRLTVSKGQTMALFSVLLFVMRPEIAVCQTTDIVLESKEEDNDSDPFFTVKLNPFDWVTNAKGDLNVVSPEWFPFQKIHSGLGNYFSWNGRYWIQHVLSEKRNKEGVSINAPPFSKERFHAFVSEIGLNETPLSLNIRFDFQQELRSQQLTELFLKFDLKKEYGVSFLAGLFFNRLGFSAPPPDKTKKIFISRSALLTSGFLPGALLEYAPIKNLTFSFGVSLGERIPNYFDWFSDIRRKEYYSRINYKVSENWKLTFQGSYTHLPNGKNLWRAGFNVFGSVSHILEDPLFVRFLYQAEIEEDLKKDGIEFVLAQPVFYGFFEFMLGGDTFDQTAKRFEANVTGGINFYPFGKKSLFLDSFKLNLKETRLMFNYTQSVVDWDEKVFVFQLQTGVTF